MRSTKYFWSVVILGMLWLAVVSFRSTPAATLRISTPAKLASAQSPEATKLHAVKTYGELPLSFEANEGQTGGPVNFVSRGVGYTLFLTPTEAVLSLGESVPSEDRAAETLRGMSNPAALRRLTSKSGPLPIPKSTVLRVQLVGANPVPHLSGLEELPGKSNYFIGNDPKQWRTNIPTYSRVRYQEVYPGVDLVYYGNQRQLEHDFIVASGADPKVIALRFHGANKLEVDAQGDLVLHVGEGEVRLRKPSVYQEVDGVKRPIAGGYELKGTHQVGFEVTAYDKTKPLVIDPVLVYSTYLGGGYFDAGQGIAVDSSGNAYVTGQTSSLNFPTANALQRNNAGGFDAFVTKLNAAGSALVYSTYLGGSNVDQGFGIAVDSSGNAYVTGNTLSTDFPTTAGAFQTTFGGTPLNSGHGDAFVTKLNATGSALVYSTYLGGSSFETGYGIAVDSSGNAHVTGLTGSTNFPTTAGAFQTTFGGGIDDAFVAKLSAAGNALLYSTYLGGLDLDVGFAIAVDSSGNAYVTGETESANFPTLNPFQAGCSLYSGYCSTDAFVTKLNATGSALVYSTYLGGSGWDAAFGIAVDSSGNAYVTGETGSANFPTLNPFQAGCSLYSGYCSADAFVTKLNATGSALVYSTYLGGSGVDSGQGITVDSFGNAYVTGFTGSTNFPTANAIQSNNGGVVVIGRQTFLNRGCSLLDAFVTGLNAAGNALVYSTYLGGCADDQGFGIAVDSSGNAYVTGLTQSTNFPTANAIQAGYAGNGDAFVAKINPATPSPSPKPR